MVIGALHRFFADARGNFSMMFVFASIPLIAGVGMAIEYANISRTQLKLQNAVDAAVLFAGRYQEQNDAMPSLDDVRRFVDVNFDGSVRDVQVRVVNEEILVEASANPGAVFLGGFLPERFVHNASATVPVAGGTNLELVMVLDNTYSMIEDNKMVDLKRIAKDFVDTIAEEAGDNDVRIGLVPFTDHVNVGMSHRNASWIDVPPDSSSTEERCSWQREWAYSNCRMETRYRDGVPREVEVCDREEIDRQWVCRDRTINVRWRGCVGSRQAPLTLKDSEPNVRFEGLMNVSCGRPLEPLTDNFTDLKRSIDRMNPTQETYIAPGVMWGLRLLTPDVPFTEAEPAAPNRRKVMILMTDGENQRSAKLSQGARNNGTDLVQADDWSKQACAEAKARGVTIFSIAFGDVPPEGKAVMQACATEASGFYDSRDAAALEAAFEDIGRRISKLRLTS